MKATVVNDITQPLTIEDVAMPESPCWARRRRGGRAPRAWR